MHKYKVIYETKDIVCIQDFIEWIMFRIWLWFKSGGINAR